MKPTEGKIGMKVKLIQHRYDSNRYELGTIGTIKLLKLNGTTHHFLVIFEPDTYGWWVAAECIEPITKTWKNILDNLDC